MELGVGKNNLGGWIRWKMTINHWVCLRNNPRSCCQAQLVEKRSLPRRNARNGHINRLVGIVTACNMPAGVHAAISTEGFFFVRWRLDTRSKAYESNGMAVVHTDERIENKDQAAFSWKLSSLASRRSETA